MMKAIVWTNYGAPDVLQLQDIAKPTPEDNEVLIRIRATTVTMGDCEIRSFKVPLFLWLPMRLWLGVRKPTKKILGQEIAGEVEAIGKDVTRFKVGDAIFGSTGMSLGAYAEYVCLREESLLAPRPVNMTNEEAAAVPIGGLVAAHFLKSANIQPGQKVLINGAGGSIGTVAVQLAKSYGAEVTAVDSTSKLAMLRTIGADHVMDYTQEDFTRDGKIYDVIFDVAGKSSYSRSLKSLTPDGYYLLGNPGLFQMLRSVWTARRTRQKVILGATNDTAADLVFLKELIEAGTIKSVIDRRYPLRQTAEAHRYVDSGQKAGNVVITVGA